MPAIDTVTIAAEDRLLRRVLHRPDFLEWHDDLERWIPSLAAIRFDPDGMSAFLRRLLEESGDGPEDVATLGGTSTKPAVVYEFDVETASSVGYTVTHTPNDHTPIGYAHTAIKKPSGLSHEEHRTARTDLAVRMALVQGSIHLPRPDGA